MHACPPGTGVAVHAEPTHNIHMFGKVEKEKSLLRIT